MHIFSLLMLLFLSIHSADQAKEKSTSNKKHKSSYPSHKLVKDMNQQELEEVIAYAKEKNDSELTFKAYYHIINTTQDHEKLKVYKLDLADYCFNIKDYVKAALKYEEFCLLYPGSQEAEYAQYKLILCTFYLSLAADRDQTDTTKTINLIQIFLKRAQNKTFVSEVETIYTQCRQRLFEHEVLVFETYLKQQKFVGSQKRLEYLQEHFKDIANIERYMTYLHSIYEMVKNPQTRPFIFKINLNDALHTKEKQEITPKDVSKAVSFFVA